jgi:hypothetical protein
MHKRAPLVACPRPVETMVETDCGRKIVMGCAASVLSDCSSGGQAAGGRSSRQAAVVDGWIGIRRWIGLVGWPVNTVSKLKTGLI